MTSQKGPRSSYAAAGVDVDAAERLVARFAELARRSRRPGVISDIGSFGGLFRLTGYSDPVLVASADGVGTKVKLAVLMGRYEGVGHDIVNHCVNDILTLGAEPLFFLDYIGGSELSDEVKLAMVGGMADACRDAGCALLGGETADMPGLYPAGEFDLVGFIVGCVERDAVIDGSRIAAGDALIGLPSVGLHTNGYSLVRQAFGVGLGGDAAEERRRLEATYEELGGESLADVLLVPHRCYLNAVRPLVGARLASPAGAGARRAAPLRGIAHITGGGIPGNVPRILPEGLGARIDRSTWETPAIFGLIQERGNVTDNEMYRAFNMGIGVVLAVDPSEVEGLLSQVAGAVVVGEVVKGAGVAWA